MTESPEANRQSVEKLDEEKQLLSAKQSNPVKLDDSTQKPPIPAPRTNRGWYNDNTRTIFCVICLSLRLALLISS